MNVTRQGQGYQQTLSEDSDTRARNCQFDCFRVAAAFQEFYKQIAEPFLSLAQRVNLK